MIRSSVIIVPGILLVIGVLMVQSIAQTVPTRPEEPSVSDVDRSFLEGARARLDQGNVAGLEDSLRDFISTHPESLMRDTALYLLGRARHASGDLSGALASLNDVVNNYPTSRERGMVFYELGRIYSKKRDDANAIASYEKAAVLLTDPSLRGDCYVRAAALLGKSGHEWRAVGMLVGAQDDAEISIVVKDFPAQIESLIRTADEDDLQKIAASFATRYPGNLAMKRLAQRYRDADNVYEETSVLRRFIKAFPSDPYAATAASRLLSLKAGLPAGAITLGIVAPISGPSAGYGISVTRGVRLAVDRAKRKGLIPMTITGVDTAEASGDASGEVGDLLSGGRILAVVGPLFSRELSWAAPMAKKYQVPFITASATVSEFAGGENFLFKNTIPYETLAGAIARLAAGRLGLKRFVVLHPDDAYGAASSRAFVDAVKSVGGTILRVESFKRDASDFSALIKRVKAMDAQWGGRTLAGKDSADTDPDRYVPGFDAIFIPAGAQQAALLASQLAFFDLNDLVLLGSGAWNDPELLKIGGRYLETAVFVDGFFAGSRETAVREFVKAYHDSYGEPPTIFAAQAYDAAGMVIKAVEQGARTGQAVREALLQTKNFPGAAGITTILPNGTVDRKLFYIQIREGRFVPFEEGSERR